MKSCKKITACLRYTLIFLVATASLVFFLWFAYSGSLLWFLKGVESIGLWGNLLFIVALAVTGLPCAIGGYTPLALAAGFIYDIFPAVTTVLIGTMLGSALGFYVTRTLLKEWVKEYVESRPLLMAFMKTMESHGFKLIVIMRMAPIPFGFQNAVFSICDIPFGSFSLASFLGLLPEIVMLVYMGATMHNLADIATGDIHFGPWQQAMLGIELGVSVVLAIVLLYLSRQAMDQVKRNQMALSNSRHRADDDSLEEGLKPELEPMEELHYYTTQNGSGEGGVISIDEDGMDGSVVMVVSGGSSAEVDGVGASKKGKLDEVRRVKKKTNWE